MAARRFPPLQSVGYSQGPFLFDDRPSVAAGIVFQWACLWTDVFKGYPKAAHEAFRNRREMNAVGVIVLLCANWKIQRLERPCFSTVDGAQQRKDPRVGC